MIKAEYIDHMGDDLRVVNSARVSFGKQKDKFEPKDEKLLNYLAKHAHYTPFEHCTITFRVECPLYIRSQIHRHRTFSYNEVSRRYTEKDIEFYIPSSFRKQHASSKQCSDGDLSDNDNLYSQMAMQKITKESLDLYNKMLDKGCAKELARGILPQCMMTEFYMTGNLRNYLNFLKLRIDKTAQYEVELIATQMKKVIEEKFPKSAKALFNNI